MAIRHRLQKIVQWAFSGRYLDRFFDFARHPFLSPRHEVEALAERFASSDFRSERPNLGRGRDTCGTDQLFEALNVARFLVAFGDDKSTQFFVGHFESERFKRHHAGTLGFEQQIEDIGKGLFHGRECNERAEIGQAVGLRKWSSS